MSIFRKIILLFSASLLLMLAIGYQVDAMYTQRTEALVTQQYLDDARKLYGLLATTEPEALAAALPSMGFEAVESTQATGAEPLLERPHSFGDMRILKTRDGTYLLAIRYMETALLLRDTALDGTLQGRWLPHLLVGLDIVLLVMIFLVIIAMLAPLGHLAAKMRAFAEGDYDSRSDVPGRDEIGAVAETYNHLAQRLQDTIVAREALLRDIGHELRTPIARGMFAAEKLPDSDEKKLLRRCFSELESMTSELLEVEKLSVTGELDLQTIRAETLILQALSKMMIDDEEKVSIALDEDFDLEGDPLYLSIALKNLIDNALKYATAYPVTVTAGAGRICVRNRGKPLREPVAKALAPFRRGVHSRRQKGFGLGLSILAKVLERHALPLSHRYEEGWHCFCIDFSPAQRQKGSETG
ncbi:ArsS family sensor histidine kinase [Sulfurimonas diazotrophicus]|uniref:histidine kinase n=1 Tax=Sulfurimonas diazotrophicus TaxID=3131939 RepID=A0ABZ3H8D3_9BACT